MFAKLNANNDFVETDGTNDIVVSSAATIVSGPVSVIIANGQSGYTETGTWQTESVSTAIMPARIGMRVRQAPPTRRPGKRPV